MSDRTEKMKAIRDELLAMKGSALADQRIKNNVFPVIGEGSHSAAIMIVGEAPGANEAKQGRPFVGASGKFLN
jgi:uracil-DNA glycosylase family 4